MKNGPTIRIQISLMKEGHEVTVNKTRIYANGDMEDCGEITLTGSNKTFVANSRQTKPDY